MSGTIRAACGFYRSTSKRAQLGTLVRHAIRGEAFSRIRRARYCEATDRVRYLHPTKGWRDRRASPELFAALLDGGAA